MSVLETFLFVFEADGDKLKKGLDDANRKTDQLEANLKDTDAAAINVGGSLMKIAGRVGAAIGSLLAFSAIKTTILETAAAIDDLGDAAAAMGIPVEELSAWTQAVAMTDGTAQGFMQSLQTINTGMVAIATTGKGKMLPFLKEMGLSMEDVETASKDPLFALLKMREAFQRLSRAEAAGLGAKIGLDQGTVNLLSLADGGMDELIAKQKEMGVQTVEQTEKAAKFDAAMKEWNHQFGAVKRELTTVALPAISEFLGLLTRLVGWMSDNKPFVVGFFVAVSGVLIGTYGPAAWAAAKATWALASPFLFTALAIGAFAVAIGLVVDDLYNFQMGNDSVTGRVAEKWPAVGTAIKGVGAALSWLIGFVAAFTNGFVTLISDGPEKAIYEFTKSIEFLCGEIDALLPGVGDAFDALTANIASAIEYIVGDWDLFVSKVKEGVAFFSKGVGYVRGLFGAESGVEIPPLPSDLRDSVVTNMKNITRGDSIIRAASSPLASQTSNSISNSSRSSSKTTTVTTGPITIKTQATDGKQVASALSSEIRAQMRGAIDENDDGVLA